MASATPGRFDGGLPDTDGGRSRRAEERRVLLARRLTADGGPAFCAQEWPEWDLVCELESEHAGAHLSYSGRGGKIGAWGIGRPSTMIRVTSVRRVPEEEE